LIVTILNRDFGEHLVAIRSATGLHVSAFARRASVEQIETVANRA
jgi:hypothetical protein